MEVQMKVHPDGTRTLPIGSRIHRRWLTKGIKYGPLLVGPIALLLSQVYAHGWGPLVARGDVATFLALGFGAGLFLSMLLVFADSFFELLTFERKYPDIRLTPDGVLHALGHAYDLRRPSTMVHVTASESATYTSTEHDYRRNLKTTSVWGLSRQAALADTTRIAFHSWAAITLVDGPHSVTLIDSPKVQELAYVGFPVTYRDGPAPPPELSLYLLHGFVELAAAIHRERAAAPQTAHPSGVRMAVTRAPALFGSTH